MYSFPTAFKNDVDEDIPLQPVALAANVLATLKATVSTDPDVMFADHAAAVAAGDDGVRPFLEVQGNAPLARIINATLYNLHASLSPDVDWSTAPGGMHTVLLVLPLMILPIPSPVLRTKLILQTFGTTDGSVSSLNSYLSLQNMRSLHKKHYVHRTRSSISMSTT